MPQNNTNDSNSGSNATQVPMSKEAASRIQSAQAKGGKDMTSGGFASRAQGAGDRNANAGIGGGNTKGNGK